MTAFLPDRDVVSLYTTFRGHTFQYDVITLHKGTIMYRGLNFNPLTTEQNTTGINATSNSNLLNINPTTKNTSKKIHMFLYPFPYAAFGVNSFGEKFRWHLMYKLTRDVKVMRLIAPSNKSRQDFKSWLDIFSDNVGSNVNSKTMKCKGRYCQNRYDPTFTKYTLRHMGIQGVICISAMDSYRNGYPMKTVINETVSLNRTMTNSNRNIGIAEIILFEQDLEKCNYNSNKTICGTNQQHLVLKPIVCIDLGKEIKVDEPLIEGLKWDASTKNYLFYMPSLRRSRMYLDVENLNNLDENAIRAKRIQLLIYTFHNIYWPWFSRLVAQNRIKIHKYTGFYIIDNDNIQNQNLRNVSPFMQGPKVFHSKTNSSRQRIAYNLAPIIP